MLCFGYCELCRCIRIIKGSLICQNRGFCISQIRCSLMREVCRPLICQICCPLLLQVCCPFICQICRSLLLQVGCTLVSKICGPCIRVVSRFFLCMGSPVLVPDILYPVIVVYRVEAGLCSSQPLRKSALPLD